MQRTSSGGVLPTVSSDYFLGTRGPKNKRALTLREKREKIERNFLAFYNKEYPEEGLNRESEGLVVIQQGSPYGMEIYFNPQPTGWANVPVIYILDKIQKGFSLVRYSGIYLLKKGKLTELLDINSVREDATCHKLANKLLEAPVYEGVFDIAFKMKGCLQEQHRPYRVYSSGEEVLLMNLLNGLIFKTTEGELLSMKPLGDKFSYGAINFRRGLAYEEGYELY